MEKKGIGFSSGYDDTALDMYPSSRRDLSSTRRRRRQVVASPRTARLDAWRGGDLAASRPCTIVAPDQRAGVDRLAPRSAAEVAVPGGPWRSAVACCRRISPHCRHERPAVQTRLAARASEGRRGQAALEGPDAHAGREVVFSGSDADVSRCCRCRCVV